MKFVDFTLEVGRAGCMMPHDPDYWAGYMRGLRRKYYGDSFGTMEEHRTWAHKKYSSDKYIKQQGRGYVDGLNFE